MSLAKREFYVLKDSFCEN